MADIFVSYARADKIRIAPLVEALEAQGWNEWWDPQIDPGEEFEDRIAEEIDIANAVTASISFYSPSSKAEEVVKVHPYWVSGQENKNGNSPQTSITLNVDHLPQAIATARRHGMRGGWDAFMMNYPRFGSLWLIRGRNDKGGGYFLPSGAKLRGPTPSTEAIAQDNEQWDRTMKNLRRAFAQATSPKCYKTPLGWQMYLPGIGTEGVNMDSSFCCLGNARDDRGCASAQERPRRGGSIRTDT